MAPPHIFLILNALLFALVMYHIIAYGRKHTLLWLVGFLYGGVSLMCIAMSLIS